MFLPYTVPDVQEADACILIIRKKKHNVQYFVLFLHVNSEFHLE